MKTTHIPLLLVAASGLLCGPRHLMAQDNPVATPPAEAPKPPTPPGDKPGDSHDNNKPKPPPPPDGERRDGDRDRDRGRRHHDGDRGSSERRGPEMKPTPFIGVMTRSLSPEVRAQTGLGEGFGLLVEEVMPDSPAKSAGLLQHDVLVLLGDQRLVNIEQLAALVRSTAKDSEIVFTIRRAGAEHKVTVKVGEKLMPAIQAEGPSRWPGMHGGGFDGPRLNPDMREGLDHFQQGMRDFQNRMQEWSRGPRTGPAPQPPQYGRDQKPGMPGDDTHGGPRGGPSNKDNKPEGDKGQPPGQPKSSTSTQSSSSTQVDGAGNVISNSISAINNNFERNVTRRDKSGEYALRQEGSEKIFTAKPLEGQEQVFTVTTDEQRKAVPEVLRVKLQELEGVSRQVKPNSADDVPAPTTLGTGRTTTI
ncbi:MAG: htrA [Verrucomicrobiaceae bacterium]|nr:htrA [Verrucomicrobiaceae bacterium]